MIFWVPIIARSLDANRLTFLQTRICWGPRQIQVEAMNHLVPTKPWMAQQVLRCQQYFLTTLVMLFDGKDIGVSKNLGATNSQTLGFNQQKLQVTCFILI